MEWPFTKSEADISRDMRDTGRLPKTTDERDFESQLSYLQHISKPLAVRKAEEAERKTQKAARRRAKRRRRVWSFDFAANFVICMCGISILLLGSAGAYIAYVDSTKSKVHFGTSTEQADALRSVCERRNDTAERIRGPLEEAASRALYVSYASEGNKRARLRNEANKLLRAARQYRTVDCYQVVR